MRTSRPLIGTADIRRIQHRVESNVTSVIRAARHRGVAELLGIAAETVTCSVFHSCASGVIKTAEERGMVPVRGYDKWCSPENVEFVGTTA
jgi:hypothetical protein